MATKKGSEKEENPPSEITEAVYGIDSFVEENPKTKSSIAGRAFKAWFTSSGGSLLAKKSMSDWAKLLEQFLTEEVK